MMIYTLFLHSIDEISSFSAHIEAFNDKLFLFCIKNMSSNTSAIKRVSHIHRVIKDDTSIKKPSRKRITPEKHVTFNDTPSSEQISTDISNKSSHIIPKDVIETYNTSNVTDDTINDTIDENISGGVKVSKKQTVDLLYFQKLIDADLRARIPISAFIPDVVNTMVKNTVGIKCKVCGSDNVYVESRQVRSADEAMTKFYTCLNCGNKWRFD